MGILLNLRQLLFTNWNFMRALRLVLGLFVGAQAIQLHDSVAGLIAIFFLYQAITNTGCCGAGGCAIPTSVSKENKIEEVEFEEIKPNTDESRNRS